jgi:DNA-binding Lrp family transcriptional regulator
MSATELDNIDKKILLALQDDFDDSPEPYVKIAMEADIAESEVIFRIRRMMDQGIIRRVGAMIRHIQAGIGFNGMVVWKVEPDRIEEVGRLLAAFPEVTHCYERPAFIEKGGNLFTMVHAETEEGCLRIVRRMSEAIDSTDYEILFSERELKKVSMRYFAEEDLEIYQEECGKDEPN